MTPQEKAICILDYGSGNVKSVFTMAASLHPHVTVSNDPAVIGAASHIILPGVGAFGASMEKVRAQIPLEFLNEEVFHHHKPFLGICVGMQLLANKGLEFGEHEGLGWIPGVVEKLDAKDHPLPHVGWNSIEDLTPHPLLKGLESGADFYFVHSFVYRPTDPSTVMARTSYGSLFPSIMHLNNVFGVQFHPEKSQRTGKLLLQNFFAL